MRASQVPEPPLMKATWQKGDASQQLRYFNEDGSPLTLGRGKSYVCIIPTNRTVTAE